MKLRRRGRLGFTLMEMLTVMWALSIAAVLGATLLLAALRADQVAATTLRGLAWRAELADQFRADVAAADATPDHLGDLAHGPACLILHQPGGNHVVYRWREGRLERAVRAGDRETRWDVTVGEGVAVEFDRAAGERPLVTLRLVETPARDVTRRTVVQAALGGDVR
jgi:type II secretory pathway component PulJ